ncbi:hypothetical protein B7463_g10547, partial [Scytalidium lignicola]
MSNLSPIPAYIFGGAFTGLGLLSFVAPKADYEIFGLPLESSPPGSSSADKKTTAVPADGIVSPMVYAKGLRNLCFGLTYFALQYKGLDEAVTIFSEVLCVAALGDGLIVWLCAGEKLKSKAFSHWGGMVPFVSWLGWRLYGN